MQCKQLAPTKPEHPIPRKNKNLRNEWEYNSLCKNHSLIFLVNSTIVNPLWSFHSFWRIEYWRHLWEGYKFWFDQFLTNYERYWKNRQLLEVWIPQSRLPNKCSVGDSLLECRSWQCFLEFLIQNSFQMSRKMSWKPLDPFSSFLHLSLQATHAVKSNLS